MYTQILAFNKIICENVTSASVPSLIPNVKILKKNTIFHLFAQLLEFAHFVDVINGQLVDNNDL